MNNRFWKTLHVIIGVPIFIPCRPRRWRSCWNRYYAIRPQALLDKVQPLLKSQQPLSEDPFEMLDRRQAAIETARLVGKKISTHPSTKCAVRKSTRR